MTAKVSPGDTLTFDVPQRQLWRRPFEFFMGFLVGLALAGLTLIFLGWRAATRFEYVSEQLPYLVSGSIAGVALVGLALSLFWVQHRRLADALERLELDIVVEYASELLAAARQSGREPRASL